MKTRIKWKNTFILILFILFLELFVISLVKIVAWYKDSKNTSKEIDNVSEITEVIEVNDSENTKIIEPEEIKKDDPYWDYISMNLIDVDFSELKSKNSDTVGWIKVNGTNINYPFVQAGDNDYYLKHSFNKSYNGAGWVFLDYRNSKDELGKNNIIYAHGRYDNTMFGSLRKIITNGWLNNKDNHVIRLSTESENTLWQVFSVYRIPTSNDYIRVEFSSDDDFIGFLDLIKNRSKYDFNTTVSANDKILTLSTCYDDNDKVVLHAKLIKIEKKV